MVDQNINIHVGPGQRMIIDNRQQLPITNPTVTPQLTTGPPVSNRARIIQQALAAFLPGARISTPVNNKYTIIATAASDGAVEQVNNTPSLRVNPNNDRNVQQALNIANNIASELNREHGWEVTGGVSAASAVKPSVIGRFWNRTFSRYSDQQIQQEIKQGYSTVLNDLAKTTQPRIDTYQLAMSFDLAKAILKGQTPVEGLELGGGKTIAAKLAFYAAANLMQQRNKTGTFGFNMPYMNLLTKAIEESPALLDEMGKTMRIEIIKEGERAESGQSTLASEVVREGPKGAASPFVLKLADSDTLEYMAQEITYGRLDPKVLQEVSHWHLDEVTDSMGRPNRIMAMADAWERIKNDPEAKSKTEAWVAFVQKFQTEMEKLTAGASSTDLFTNPVDPRVQQLNPRRRIFKGIFKEQIYALYEKMKAEIPATFGTEFGVKNKKDFLRLANQWADFTRYRLGDIYPAVDSPVGYATADPYGGSFEKTHLPDNVQSAFAAYAMARKQELSAEDTTRTMANALLSKETERISFTDVLKLVKNRASYMSATTRKYNPLYSILGAVSRIFTERPLVSEYFGGKLNVSGNWTMQETIAKLLGDIRDNGADAQAVFGKDWEMMQEAVNAAKQAGHNVEFVDGNQPRQKAQEQLESLRQRIRSGEKIIVFIMGNPIGSNIFELSKTLGTAASHMITLAGTTDLSQFLGRADTQGRKGPPNGKPSWYLTICLSRDSLLTEDQRETLHQLGEQNNPLEVSKILMQAADQLDQWDVLEARDRVVVIKYIQATPLILREIGKKLGLSETNIEELINQAEAEAEARAPEVGKIIKRDGESLRVTGAGATSAPVTINTDKDKFISLGIAG
jgi:hypothetical protein